MNKEIISDEKLTPPPIDENKLDSLLLAMLFVSGEGIDLDEVVEKLQISKKKLEKAVSALKEEFSNEKGIHLLTYKNKIQLATNPAHAEAISFVLNPIRERALTRAALETMAIIAYKQPITRLEIEEIRGVSSDYTVQVLLDHNLVEIVGRKDAVGKPLLFGTTETFLKRFCIENLESLPSYEEILERVKLIHTDEEKSASLYRDFMLPDEEEVPEFLEGEETEKIVVDPRKEVMAKERESRLAMEKIDKQIKERLKMFDTQVGEVLSEAGNE